MGKHPATEKKAIAVYLMTKTSKKLKEIEEETGMSKSALMRLKRRFKEQTPAKQAAMTVPKRKPGSGSQDSISLAQCNRIKKCIWDNPRVMARKLKFLVPGLENRPVRTIQDWCKNRLNLPSRVMAKKPCLTQKMKDKCVQFVWAHLHWTVDDWAKVMWSDEFNFEV